MIKTVEEKAKAYDKAKYIMKEYLESGNAGVIAENTIKKAFPELVEPEDERIRKELLQIAKKSEDSFYMVMTPEKRKHLITWLEKQGEQKSAVIIPKFRVGDEIKTSNEESLTITKIDNKGYWSEDLFICGFDEECIWDLVGQKHADKIEPKFKVGDWVVRGKTIAQILDIQEQYYIGLDIDGNDFTSSRFLSNDKIHLWTIKDAKEGDVLVCKGDIKNSNGIKYERICIFKNLDNAFFALTKTSNYVEEYGIDVRIDYPDNTVPSTKEQKEILFMVMKEAGYVWDTEDKQLKKIEQKHTPKHKVGDTIYYNSFGELKSMIVANVTTGGTDNPMYEDENGNAVFEKDLVEQKTAWSEEDDYNLQCCIAKVQNDIDNGRIGRNRELLTWLKSLRPQNSSITDEELAQAKKDAYNDALDKIEYHNGEPTFDDGWSAAIWYLKKRNVLH